MEVKHVGEAGGTSPGWSRSKLRDFGAFVFFAFSQEGYEPYVRTITIEPMHVSGRIMDVSVKILVGVDKFGLHAEDTVPVRLQLNIDPQHDIVEPTRRIVDAVHAQLACIAADARRLAGSLQHFEQTAVAA